MAVQQETFRPTTFRAPTKLLAKAYGWRVLKDNDNFGEHEPVVCE